MGLHANSRADLVDVALTFQCFAGQSSQNMVPPVPPSAFPAHTADFFCLYNNNGALSRLSVSRLVVRPYRAVGAWHPAVGPAVAAVGAGL